MTPKDAKEHPLTIEGLLEIGSVWWFEYHCWEDEKSTDAELWHHSHQKATVIGIAPNDGMEIPTHKARWECGQPLSFKVRFADGFESVACEDELMSSKQMFCRPDPPPKKQPSDLEQLKWTPERRRAASLKAMRIWERKSKR
jgi:hypothetical protein